MSDKITQLITKVFNEGVFLKSEIDSNHTLFTFQYLNEILVFSFTIDCRFSSIANGNFDPEIKCKIKVNGFFVAGQSYRGAEAQRIAETVLFLKDKAFQLEEKRSEFYSDWLAENFNF